MPLCYKDRTFCGNPNCDNSCGRQITKEEEEHARQINLPIAFADFCSRIKENEQSE